MIYTVEIKVTPTKGNKLTITHNVEIEYDADRKMYKAKPDGVWTYGETAQGLAIRLATHDWQMHRA